MEETIRIDHINREEALRYMGAAGMETKGLMAQYLDACEKELLKVMRPAFVYKVFDVDQLELPGKDIREHLKGCRQCAFLCATLSTAVDQMIRKYSILDMTKSLMIDAMASAAVEEVCNQAEIQIKAVFPDKFLTWRYGVGYGDFDIHYQRTFLEYINAYKTIGVSVSDSCMLNPVKSVTCIIGLSDTMPEKSKRGCSNCNLAGKCQFRKKGERCGF